LSERKLQREGAAGDSAIAALGWSLACFARLASTNDEARAAALDGHPGRLWIVAEEQTAGRGRRGRSWASPRGNLYASALLLDPAPIAKGAEVGFVAGLALHRAIGDLGGRDFALKWPNDLIWRGTKVAGLLAEGVSLPGGRFACIVGIGVNCLTAPQVEGYATADLSQAIGRRVQPAELFVHLARRFDDALAEWRRGEGFAAIRAAWLAAASGLGEPIRISDPSGVREGLFEALDARGRLLLRRAERLEIVEAGDLTLIGDGARSAPVADGLAKS
jgi:BirA family transcriptional regulator, biotin operon repressor / biotin---[acetyl-CoA-carboxylase] ligase